MEWNTLFTNAFEFVKQDLTEFYGKNLDEVTPNEQAILTGLSKLPFPIRIIDVSVDNLKYTHLQDDTSQLIHCDLEKIGTKQTNYFGKISSEKDTLVKTIVHYFEISENDSKLITDSITKNFEYTGFKINDTSYVKFTRYNIIHDPNKFYEDFRYWFTSTFNDYFTSKYNTETKIDFNIKYNLESNTILPSKNLLVPEPRTVLSLEKLQEIVSDMQFSPHVPKSVQEEFQRAKDLFVFSYFRYEFITLSVRSALFAYETAMKLRYVKSLENKAVIKYNSEIVYELTNPSYHKISEFIHGKIKEKKWKLKYVTVNDNQFPLTMKRIMYWLVDNGIPKWKFRMYHAVNYLRNSLAHTEQQIILDVSSSTTLRNIVYDINEMFEP